LHPAVKISSYEIRFTIPLFQFLVALGFATLYISIGFFYDNKEGVGIFRVLWKFIPLPAEQQIPPQVPHLHKRYPKGQKPAAPAFATTPAQFEVPLSFQPKPSTSSAPSTSTPIPEPSFSYPLRPAVFRFSNLHQQDFHFTSLQQKGQLKKLGVYYEDEEAVRGLYWTKDRSKLSEEEVEQVQEQLSDQPLDEGIDKD